MLSAETLKLGRVHHALILITRAGRSIMGHCESVAYWKHSHSGLLHIANDSFGWGYGTGHGCVHYQSGRQVATDHKVDSSTDFNREIVSLLSGKRDRTVHRHRHRHRDLTRSDH